MSQLLLQMKGITKKFGVVQALKQVDLAIYSHEIHALLGENGAGKSTLMKVLAGLYRPSAGEMRIKGKSYPYWDHNTAARLGIGIIYQELSLIDELSVLENLYIGKLPQKTVCGLRFVDWRRMRQQAAMILLRLGIKVDLDEKVANLSISYKQMVEIAKVLIADVKIIIMDEPTSSLTNKEIELLFVVMRQLKADGKALIYISHKLNEIRQICDRYTVLKDGCRMASGMIKDVSNGDMIRLMVGRELPSRFTESERIPGDDIIFAVKHLTAKKTQYVNDVSFALKRGEILGFAGLVGSGRTELMNCLFGVEKTLSGKIYLHQREITPNSPLQAVKRGMAYITENRRGNGFFANFSIQQNIMISHGLKSGKGNGGFAFIDSEAEYAVAQRLRQQLRIKCNTITQNITELSGGNQQKVIIAKWIACQPEVLIFDEPTRGIDVGAKAEIYKIMRQLSAAGKAILMVSSELPEIIAVCDRIAVYREGRIATILENHHSLSEAEIMHYALPFTSGAVYD